LKDFIMNRLARGTLLVVALLATAACSTTGPIPRDAAEAREHAEFQRDRDRCRRVAEMSIDYVDPAKPAAVARRSQRVEAAIQSCMLRRGWNNPEYDGWADGRR
jgi:hypothetical protein